MTMMVVVVVLIIGEVIMIMMVYPCNCISLLSPQDTELQPMDMDTTQSTPTTSAKIILTGPKHKTLHKEELTVNKEEQLTKARITHRAAFSQKRKSPKPENGTTKHGKQEVVCFIYKFQVFLLVLLQLEAKLLYWIALSVLHYSS